ncbi:hypothetical protein [Actimicrobium sp. CCI2.3]|uniref:hypothetical protein n=1 Tax=Actimicrobium sp. CCI2.3 TaxID=3048616 RepID=UPI002AB521BC|nr:hypothetical protein [Actimicrobium sp. CCI2.3]MDY7573036.1 hypothetical protein [Actimicrobium sp. CCI2.3]MEB0020833.1 hypothetical protein [Actimicrobium sp. CCI2.3]
MKPIDSSHISPAQNTAALAALTTDVTTPAVARFTAPTNTNTVIESTGGRKKSNASMIDGDTSSRWLHQNLSRLTIEEKHLKSQQQIAGSFRDVTGDILKTIHSFLNSKERVNHSQTCKPILEEYRRNQEAAAGSFREFPKNNLQLIDSYLNSKDSKNLSQTCTLIASLKLIARQYRYPTLDEIREMISDPKAKGKKFSGEIQLPPLINDNELTSLINQGLMSKITKLDLSNCMGITNTGLSHLKKCKSLRSLDLSGCTSLTDNPFSPLINLKLEHLCLRSCIGMRTHLGMISLAFLPLRSLDLSNCTLLTRFGVNIGGRTTFRNRRRFESLESLNLSGCAHFDNQAMTNLGQMPLKILDISGCHLIDDNALGVLHQLPLTSLNISACPLITDVGRASLNAMHIAKLTT